MFIKILLTALFILLNFLIFIQLKKEKNLISQKIKLLFVLAVILLFILYFTFNNENIISSKIFVVNLIYSFTLIIFYFLFRIIRLLMNKRYKKIDNDFVRGYIKVLNFIEQKLVFILITIFQIMVIWNPSVIEGMNI